MKNKMRIIPVLTVMVAVLSLACVFTTATVWGETTDEIVDEGTITTSGPYGDYLFTWKFTKDGTMTLSTENTNAEGCFFNDIPEQYRKATKTIRLGDGITKLHDYGFFGFDNVTSIVLPSTIMELGEGSFGGLSLEEITVPSTVRTIDPNVFYAMNSLKKVVFNCPRINLNGQTMNEYNIETIVFGNNVKSISPKAFKGSQSIHTVLFLGDCDYSYPVFEGSDNLNIFRKHNSSAVLEEHIGTYKKVTVPSSVQGLSVVEVGPYAFEGNHRVVKVSLANSIKKINKYAFYNCSRLENINLPDGMATIGTFAFYGCNSITSLTIPDSVTSIGDFAFQNCYALKTVKIGESVQNAAKASAYSVGSVYAASKGKNTKICAGAFKGCNKLKSVTIGKSVSKIGAKAFYKCKLLKIINIKTKKLKASSIGGSAFKGINKKAVIKVPKSKFKAYKKLLKKKGVGKKVKIRKL